MHQRGPVGAAGAAEAGRARDRGRGDARWVGLPQGPAGAALVVRAGAAAQITSEPPFKPSAAFKTAL